LSLTLVIANKTYSSWSFRPWILMRHYGIAFDELMIPLAQDHTREEILRVSPSGKCPALHDGDIKRLHIYDAPVTAATRAYMDAMMALPAWQEWQAQAQAEPGTIGKYEVA
jgi:Glutathione S-transferase, N-terminal domain